MKVVMYGTKACPDCVEAEEILKEKGIPVSVYGIFRQYRISETFPHTPRHKPDL